MTTLSKPSKFQITSRIQVPVVIFQVVMGSTLGLYCYIFGPILYNKLTKNGLTEESALWWTAAVFIVGLLLELPFEILTGVFADGLGRKFSVVVSLAFRGLFFGTLIAIALLPHGSNWSTAVISTAILAVTLFAIHYTMQSGSFDAWMAGSLDEQAQVERDRPLTDEEANERATCLTRLSFRGEILFDAAQLFGTLAGVYYHSVLRLPAVSFLCGFAMCLFGACACGLYMRENRGLFARPSEMLTGRAGKVVDKMWQLLQVGIRDFLRDIRLWVAFTAMAAFMSLVYLVDLVWVLYSEKRFSKDFTDYWYLFVAAFILTSLAGNLASAWYFERRSHNSIRSLIWLNFGLSFAFAIPMIITVFVITPKSGTAVLFLLLMSSHRMFEGATRAAGKALRNSLIKPGSVTTATMLSFGQVFSNICISGLVLLGVGKNPTSLGYWLVPALAILITTTLMTIVLLRSFKRTTVN